MVCIQFLSRVNSYELLYLFYQYTIWLIYHFINRQLVKALIVAWYKHNNISYTIPFADFVIWGCKIIPSTTSKVNIHWTPVPTQILVTLPLSWTLPLSLKVHMDSSWYIPIPSKLLSTLTLRHVSSRDIFIATFMIIILNYTPSNPCLLVTS